MTRDELEWKAEMYERLHANSKLWQAYKDGYEEGRRIESDLIFESWCKDQSSPCGFLLKREAEIKNLKNIIEKMKNCENCKHRLKVLEMEVLDLDKDELREPCNVCNGNLDKWEMNE